MILQAEQMFPSRLLSCPVEVRQKFCVTALKISALNINTLVSKGIPMKIPKTSMAFDEDSM